MASYNGNIEIVKYLIANGAGIDDIVMPPLHLACRSGHLEIVKYLTSCGANIHYKIKYGLTPLHIAVMNDHTAIVEYLISIGANINSLTSEHHTPIHFADALQKLETLATLIHASSNSYINID